MIVFYNSTNGKKRFLFTEFMSRYRKKLLEKKKTTLPSDQSLKKMYIC